MEDTLKALVSEVEEGIPSVQSRPDFEAFKARFVGPNGSLKEAMRGMAQVSKEDKPRIGKLINEAKKALEAIFQSALDSIEAVELKARLGEAVDPSLPSPDPEPGNLHPLTQVRNEIVQILKSVGFVVAEGPEVETEYFCFDALNTPKDHPARDLQDTFYLPEDATFGNVSKQADERYLLRTHTSTVQIRTMLKQDPPVRIISPGRCFRRDSTDATHSASFTQVEGLYVDKGVTVMDLKAILDFLLKSLLGQEAKTRFRPHFFPYTEPSFEMDASSAHLAKVGKEWVELGGCGMVDPNVFKAVDYDPQVYSGYAFGFGIERIAMIMYGIDDIRYFYQNDYRFLKQFI
ncbi:MAG: phenylalanine--tRNA ligase subunit alpha [Opitutaceae bacterium]|nr:phenylalanine--tRNA ligase subunit alpha [Opitutaceae bacterium]